MIDGTVPLDSPTTPVSIEGGVIKPLETEAPTEQLQKLYENLAVKPILQTLAKPETIEELMEYTKVEQANKKTEQEALMIQNCRIAIAVMEAWKYKQDMIQNKSEYYVDKDSGFQEGIKDIYTLRQFFNEVRNFYPTKGEPSVEFLDSLPGKYAAIEGIAKKYITGEDTFLGSDGAEHVRGIQKAHGMSIDGDLNKRELRGEKLRMAQHDISQPLTMIEGFAELFEDSEDLGDSLESCTDAVTDSIRRVPQFLIDGQALIENSTFPVEDIGRTNFDRVFGEERIPIMLDESFINQKVKNSNIWLRMLLRNAIKNANEHGSTKITAKVSLSENGEAVVLDIDNNGKPFPQKRIVEGFIPGGTDRVNEGGTGTAMGFLTNEATRSYPGTTLIPINGEGYARVRVTIPIESKAS